MVYLLAQLQEALSDQNLEIAVDFGRGRIHELELFVGELERTALEVDATGGAVDHEAKVNVHDMSLAVDQDVAIVTVFDVQNLCHQGVGCQALNEGFAALVEPFRKDMLVDKQQILIRKIFLETVQ